MKPIILYFLFVCCSFNLFAQGCPQSNLFVQEETESVDCIILVDGKLVISIYGYIQYTDSTQQTNRIGFDYHFGKMVFKKKEKQRLYSLSDTTSVILHLFYVDSWIDKSDKSHILRKTYEYEYSLCIKFLPKRTDSSSDVYSITNFNKKKGIYHFHWASWSNEDRKWVQKWQWKPEYGRKAHKKVYSAYENVS